jgi:hypothetical protein
MRRLATIALLAAGTAAGVLYWLHDGDLAGAVEPVLPEWGALAHRVEQAVVADEPLEPAGPPPTLEAGIAPVAAPAAAEVSGGPEGEQP